MKYLNNYTQFINESAGLKDFGDGIFGWLYNKEKRLDKKVQKLIKLADEAENKGDDKRAEELRDEAEELINKDERDYLDKINKDFIKKLNLGKSEAIQYYRKWFNNKDTQNKFKNKENLKEIKSLLDGVKVFHVPHEIRASARFPNTLQGVAAFVLIPRPQGTKGIDSNLKLKKCQLTEKESEELVGIFMDSLSSTFKWRNFENIYWVGGVTDRISTGSQQIAMTQKTITQTIVHEIGHLIDYKLSSLGEVALSNYFDQSPEMEPGGLVDDEGNPHMVKVPYTRRSDENAARLRVFRKFLGLSPTETPFSILNKFVDKLKKGELSFCFVSEKWYKAFEEDDGMHRTFKDGILEVGSDKKTLIVKNSDKYGFGDGEVLLTVAGDNLPKLRFYKVDNEDMLDISSLLASYSRVENNTLIIDFEEITKINNKLAMNQKDSVASKTA